jgi:hypothetical protein
LGHRLAIQIRSDEWSIRSNREQRLILFDGTKKLVTPQAEGTYRKTLFSAKLPRADSTRFPGGDHFAPERFALARVDNVAIAVAALMFSSSIALPSFSRKHHLHIRNAAIQDGIR